MQGSETAELAVSQLRDMLIGGARTVCENKDPLNRMNVFPVPDGDTGTNLAMTLTRMETAVAENPDCETPGALADAAAHGALLGARGNSGVIMSQILRGFADGLDSRETLSPMDLAQALVSASDRAYQAVIKPVEGTILTVIKDAAGSALMRALDHGVNIRQVLDAALSQARETLARTPSMLEKLRQAGVVDAGGQGLVYFLEGMLKALLGQALPVKRAQAATLMPDAGTGHDGEIAFKYCTEVSFQAPPGALDAVRAALMNDDTDSLLVVGAGEMVKIHVHTNRPDTVLAQALHHGDLLEVKVDNMAVQHNETLVASAQHTEAADSSAPPGPRGRTAVAVVANGAGLHRIFRDLGAAVIIDGGQSMNPSTEDILNALRAAPEPELIILPNNGNIVMAAERAAELDGRPVRVVPTRNVPQGLAALMDYDPEAPAEDLARAMTESMSAVQAAEITRAVRDASAGDLRIREGDFIAIVQGSIQACSPDLFTLLCSVLAIFADQDLELVTFYSGEDISGAEAGALLEQLKEKYPDFDYAMHRGGQPLYHFLISGE